VSSAITVKPDKFDAEMTGNRSEKPGSGYFRRMAGGKVPLAGKNMFFCTAKV
jgi:hypothetical protein